MNNSVTLDSTTAEELKGQAAKGDTVKLSMTATVVVNDDSGFVATPTGDIEIEQVGDEDEAEDQKAGVKETPDEADETDNAGGGDGAEGMAAMMGGK